MENPVLIQAAALCALAGAIILVLMGVVSSGARDALRSLDHPERQEDLADILRPSASPLVRLMALDNLFVIAYTATFIGAAALAWGHAFFFSAAGLAFALLLALLDLTENAVIVHISRAVKSGVRLSGRETSAISVLGQVKYATGTMAVALIALGLALGGRDDGPWHLIVALLYLLFPLWNAIAVIKPDWGNLRVAWMLLMLLVSSAYLWWSAAHLVL